MFTYSPNAKKGIVTLEKAKKNYEEDIKEQMCAIYICMAVCKSKGISANSQ